MSGRSGAGQIRGAAVGPQPLKATIPYKLASKPRPSRKDGKPGMSFTPVTLYGSYSQEEIT